jgi:2'-5' RNA ligase
MKEPGMLRTFLAVYPDASTLSRLAAVAGSFRDRTPAIRWSPAEQLHFTLRFFGDLDAARRNTVVDVLGRMCPAMPRVSFPLNGLGAFPDWKRPRVIWAGAGAGGEDLENVARRLDLAFAERALGRADRPFKAHLTLGRVRDGQKLDADLMEALRTFPFSTPPIEVRSVRLMASELTPRGAIHALLEEVPLGGPPGR